MPLDQIYKQLLNSHPENLDKINNLLKAILLNRFKEITPGTSFSKPKVLWEVEQYVQLTIHRVYELGEGATEAWNNSHPAICFILTRALIENVAALVDVITQIESFVGQNNLTEIHNLVVNRLLGGKLGDFPAELKISNILTAIDKTDNHFPDHQVRTLYDFLSEFAHPNSLGMHGLYGHLDAKTQILTIDPANAMTRQHFTVITQSLVRILSIWANTVLKVDTLYAQIIKIAEQDESSQKR